MVDEHETFYTHKVHLERLEYSIGSRENHEVVVEVDLHEVVQQSGYQVFLGQLRYLELVGQHIVHVEDVKKHQTSMF